MKKLKLENINNILFLDIETAPNWEHFKDAPEDVRKEWIYKFKYRDEAPRDPAADEITPTSEHLVKKYEQYFSDLWKKQAGLFPEFSRIVCVSLGYMYNENFRLKSVTNVNEGVLLEELADTLAAFTGANKFAKLCAHYGKGFDYPFIAKRLLIHRKPLPFILDTYGLKPWEMESLLDTHEIWKIGNFNGGGTLSSIAMAFGIPSPKDEIDGSDVSRLYHSGEIDKIVTYCDKDVVTLLNVFKSIRGEALLNHENLIKTML